MNDKEKYFNTDAFFGTRLEGVDYYDRPGAYLVCVCGGKTLVINTPKGYFLLGGGIENSESHEECIRREIMEEVGCGCTVGGYIGCAESFYKHSIRFSEHLRTIQYYYSGSVTDKLCEPSEEGNELVWLPVDGIEQAMHKKDQAWAILQCLKKSNG